MKTRDVEMEREPESAAKTERRASGETTRAESLTTAVPLLSLAISADYSAKPGVLRNLNLEMQPGEILGLVGESGSGKSTLALSILRLLDLKGGKTSGSIRLKGRELTTLSESEMRSIRGRDIGLILQSPMSSLNPALKISTQMYETWRAHEPGTRKQCTPRFLEILRSLNLDVDEKFLNRKPAQLSVGQAQRVLIAMAVLHRPSLLLADECTSSLDLITQKEVLNIFRQLSRDMGTGILFISHDLLAVSSLCHRIAILRNGELVEVGLTSEILKHPSHPYTRDLVNALPVPEVLDR
ncbi:MAG TPA: ABC transporter ATP-binding protein [Terriglobales bacterium]|nr:ABC transporter ATP-binding protein [Terriglobales bacterium]